MAAQAEFAAVEPVLRALLGPCALSGALPSGSGGTSFLVEAAGRTMVAKRFTADAAVLLGPARQFELLQSLSAAGIAPAPVCFDARSRILVVDFVADARSQTSAMLRESQSIGQVAALLGRLHRVELELPAFAPAAYAETYLARIGGREALARADERRFDELLELASLPIPGSPCVCHNDLGGDNILIGTAIRLIDFDYAVSAPPIVDLASLAVMNSFTQQDVSHLIAAYFSGRPPFAPEEFARVQRLVGLLAHFWALAQAERSAFGLSQYRIEDD
jgi:thiamine kinase-like enzyme